MAINKVVYNTENGAETLIDLTGDTVTPETLAKGVTAHDKSGTTITGTLDTRCKSYEITLAKQYGRILLATLDSEVLEHINDTSLVVTLNNMSDYVLSKYTGYNYLVRNVSTGMVGTLDVYGMGDRVQSAESTAPFNIYYPANYTGTSTSNGGYGVFHLIDGKYYITPGDGYIAAGTYRLTFIW
jgi:hypothetical protein